MKKTEWRYKAGAFIPLLGVLVFITVIFLFSSQSGWESHRLSKGVVRFFKNLIPSLSLLNCIEFFRNISFDWLVRKAAHFTMYFVLSLLVYIAAVRFEINVRKSMALTVIVCILYSITDEIHQIFVIGRTPLVSDVIIDALGSVTAMWFLRYLTRRRKAIMNK